MSKNLPQAQTELIVAALMQVDPDLRVDRVVISTNGDRTQPSNVPGPDWGTGVFVKEIETALLRDEIDLAVHSLKDVPPIVMAELTLAAIPVRDDPHDVLVTQRGLSMEDLEPGARVGTSSARRVAFSSKRAETSHGSLFGATSSPDCASSVKASMTRWSWRAPVYAVSRSRCRTWCSSQICCRRRQVRALWRCKRGLATATSCVSSSRCMIRPPLPRSGQNGA